MVGHCNPSMACTRSISSTLLATFHIDFILTVSREPWKPSLDDLQLRGGEWAMIAERVEKLVDRCYGARLSVLRELGLSLPKSVTTLW